MNDLYEKYRSNLDALKILHSLDCAANEFNGKLPISFYIADCDEVLLRKILNDLNYVTPKTERIPIGRDIFCIMVRPGG